MSPGENHHLTWASASLRDLTGWLLPWGTGAALTACLLNGLWLFCLIFLENVGHVSEHARAFPSIFRLSVGSTLLLTLTQVPLLLTMVTLAAQRDVARALIGGAFYLLHIPINLVGYFTFGRLAPMVHSSPHSELKGAELIAEIIEIGNPLGFMGSLPLLGYGLLGLAWSLLASPLWDRGGWWRVASALLFTSGLLSVMGATGEFINVSWLAVCCLLGGVVSLPALAVTAVAMWRESRLFARRAPTNG